MNDFTTEIMETIINKGDLDELFRCHLELAVNSLLQAEFKLSEENIQKILETYAERKDVEKYAHLATFDEIKENDYNLNIPRYVDTFEEEEPIDMVHVGNDIKKIRQEQQVLEKELLEAISSLQTTPENEAWLQGALEVFKHE